MTHAYCRVNTKRRQRLKHQRGPSFVGERALGPVRLAMTGKIESHYRVIAAEIVEVFRPLFTGKRKAVQHDEVRSGAAGAVKPHSGSFRSIIPSVHYPGP